MGLCARTAFTAWAQSSLSSLTVNRKVVRIPVAARFLTSLAHAARRKQHQSREVVTQYRLKIKKKVNVNSKKMALTMVCLVLFDPVP